jgi:hypothetical protein
MASVASHEGVIAEMDGRRTAEMTAAAAEMRAETAESCQPKLPSTTCTPGLISVTHVGMDRRRKRVSTAHLRDPSQTRAETTLTPDSRVIATETRLTGVAKQSDATTRLADHRLRPGTRTAETTRANARAMVRARRAELTATQPINAANDAIFANKSTKSAAVSCSSVW